MNRRAFLIGTVLGAVAAPHVVRSAGYAVGMPEATGGYGLAGSMKSRMPVGNMTQIFTRQFGAIGWHEVGDGFHDDWIGGCVVAGRSISLWERP